MPLDRLSALDVAFLCLEGANTPMHMGAVATFRPRRHVDPERLVALLAQRAAGIPKLRRRVRSGLPLLGGAQWEDDPGFDALNHIGLSKLCDLYEPDPLAEFASHWMAEPLELDAPLWNVQLVTGLPDGEFALLVKFHHALTDGAGAVELAFGLLDDISLPVQRGGRAPQPEPEPRTPLQELRDGATAALGQAATSAGIASAVLRAARPYPISPTATLNSALRRIGLVRLDLGDVRSIRKTHGGTNNDVVLAVLAGALRDWMINRGQRADARSLRALIPVSLRGREAERAGGNVLSGYLCDLPVELDDPVDRLRVVRDVMARNKQAGPARGPGAIPILANRMPAGIHRIATKVAGRAAPLLFDTVVTNVPLPGIPMSLGGARLREIYPFVPLAPHQSVGIAVSTYRNALHIGLQANGEAVPDVGSLADAVTKSLAALYQRSL
ncbi:wax ester/triacylglycerol synthase family O-acyltransferase [Prauserella cavernicola]|uniref:Diacylglycerol O-acyltransferase n=1 Tax=Prauserella cavernicola TaxID=2800127 RepID=A0A934QTQ7_9PSEU|nr:wax ester/triacylglycerol synthase family O-acyltransferase [Prauserella cavernicola]MBK1786137.1 wax ester/triacylglycerol synthase family O-acyltransferase [Prauserella cavernicola]